MKYSKLKGNEMHNNMEKSQNTQAEWMKSDKRTSTCSISPWLHHSRSKKLVNVRGHRQLGVESLERGRGSFWGWWTFTVFVVMIVSWCLHMWNLSNYILHIYKIPCMSKLNISCLKSICCGWCWKYQWHKRKFQIESFSTKSLVTTVGERSMNSSWKFKKKKAYKKKK